jgi:pilus assembly protein FimV
VEQYTRSQYDDDLTVGMDEYDDSLQTDNVDLFDFVSDEESPITRLKTLILSIDWEITDDILRQFNIELLDLKDIWANNKINLVYVQALEKISKYIYKEKANANPNAIKLLLNFYTNLEKIVSTESMPEEEKKRLIMEDVEKFEKLKKQISRSSGKTQARKTTAGAPFKTAPAFRADEPLPTDIDSEDPLLNLKAIIFGMDWEITEGDLLNLGEEVRQLEKRFSNSKAKLIFLQGIGALGAYINLKRSNAHADAFKLLHSFFLSLENTVRNRLSGEEEKRVLMPEVEKFNAFKSAIAFTLSPDAIASEGERQEELSAELSGVSDDIAPAFADMPDEIRGFQEEEEAATLGYDAKQKVDGQIEKFFEIGQEGSGEGAGSDARNFGGKSDLIGEMESRLQGFFGEDSTLEQTSGTSEDIALQGVVVETEADDDSDEERLPRFGDELAPALSDNFEESSYSEKAIAGQLGETESSFEMKDQGIFTAAGESRTIEDMSAALQGVEIETEADDDSEEAPLPREDEELAPALFGLDDGKKQEIAETEVSHEEASSGIEGRLDEFFGDDFEPSSVNADQNALQGVDVGIEEEENFDEGDLSSEDDFSPALFSAEEVIAQGEEGASAVSQEETLSEIDTGEFIADDAEQMTVVPIEEAFSSVDVVADKDTDVDHQPQFFQDAEVSPGLSASEDEFVLETVEQQDLSEEKITDDLEDHLKEFFEEGNTESSTEEEPEIDFTEAALETEKDTSSGIADIFSITDDESASVLVEEDKTVHALEEEYISEEEPADLDSSLVFEMDESEKEVFSEEGMPETGVFTIPEEENGDFLADIQESESDSTLEKAEEVSFVADESGEPVFAAAEEPSDIPSTIQVDDDSIDYIEGVEFDSEEEGIETVFEPVRETEQVVFEAADKGSIFGTEPDEHVNFEEAEEELDKFFAEHDDLSEIQAQESEEPEKTDGYLWESETFGKSFEEDQGLVGSEIQMEAFSEPPSLEKSSVFEGLIAPLAEDNSSSGKIEPQVEQLVFAEVDSSSTRGDDPLSNLRTCVTSLGLEVNDSILGSLFNEVDNLKNLWIAKPLEKTLLQLLSTVAQHIDNYRHDANPEAHGLIMSVFDKLELSMVAGVENIAIQEALLSETSKVLLWQQKMLTRKATEKDDDFGAVFEAVDDNTEVENLEPVLFLEEEREHIGISQEEGRTLEQGTEPYVIKKDTVDALDTEKITQIVRVEMEALRQSFRSEINDLLHQHFDKNASGSNDR